MLYRPIFSIIFSLAFTNIAFAQIGVQKIATRSNPDISLNILMLGRAGDRGNDPASENPNGFQFQEAEVRFTSNIDSYFRADAILAFEKEAGEFKVEPEEVFIETLAIPDITIKMGKFLAQVGRHNGLHTHSFPFIDSPLTNEAILGDEGLNEVGVSVSYLMPTPWYFEVVGQGFSAENESLFNSDSQDDLAGLLFLKNLWDLSDASTLEFDLGFATGSNSFAGKTELYNLSMTYKWRPIEKSTYRSFLWTTEFLQSSRSGSTDDMRIGGISSWVQWQFDRRWWLQAREEYLGLPKLEAGITRKHSALIGFFPTEYSGLRLQYDQIDEATAEKHEHRVTLQLNVSLGTHPAHNY